MLAALSALFARARLPEWREDFVGKPGFGQCTRILALPDRLVFLDSPPPTVSDGGDIYVWRDDSPRPRKVFSVDEQGIRTLKRFGSQLIVPGIDAKESWDWGNWYLSSDKGETWTKYRNLPRAIHVFDVARWRGRLYMGISDPEGAVVSSDTGKVWRKDFGACPKGSFAGVLSLVALPDALYAFWVEQWGSGPQEANSKADCYRFDGTKWEPRRLLPDFPHQVWETRVLGGGALILLSGNSYWLQDGTATPVPALRGLAPVDVVEDGPSSLLWLTGDALYRSAFERTKAEVGPLAKVADLPPNVAGQSLAIHDGRVFVSGGSKPSGKVVSVLYSSLR